MKLTKEKLLKLQSNGSEHELPSVHVATDVIGEIIADKEAELASSRKEEAAAFKNKRLSFVISPLPPIRKRSYRQVCHSS